MISRIPAQVLASKRAHVSGLWDYANSYGLTHEASPMIQALNDADTPSKVSLAVDALVRVLHAASTLSYAAGARDRALALIDGLTIIKQRADVPDMTDTIARMKSEILADIEAGRVPGTIASFSALHDFVDANAYGGFCDDNYMHMMVAHFGGLDEDDAWPDDLMRFSVSAQSEIDRWLKAGRPLF